MPCVYRLKNVVSLNCAAKRCPEPRTASARFPGSDPGENSLAGHVLCIGAVGIVSYCAHVGAEMHWQDYTARRRCG